MGGSTVDAMAQAVEGSAVILVGVSRAYKESSNWYARSTHCLVLCSRTRTHWLNGFRTPLGCSRLEAQYGMQKKKAMVPLMMQPGYEVGCT